MHDATAFSTIRFRRDRIAVDGTGSPEELLAFVNRPDFDFVVAEPMGGDGSEFAQAVDLDGTYQFEVTVDGELMSTMLGSAEEVVAAFADWATDRPGWRDEHDWA